jgi:hypothetical protein
MAMDLAGFDEGEDWVFNMQQQKNKLPQHTHRAIEAWLGQARSDAPLPGHQFDLIISYMAHGTDNVLLGHALGSIGYTREEIDDLKARRLTALDVARELIARGVKPMSLAN